MKRIYQIIALCFSTLSCANLNKSNAPTQVAAYTKTNQQVVPNNDTLKVGYTYWWPQSGPFIGYCGSSYTLAFLGTVDHIDQPIKNEDLLYVSQKGIINIEEVLTARDVKKSSFRSQKFFVSTCFYEQGLKKGDKVLVFCYEYEGDYSIPGGESILKIKNSNDQVVRSIKRYIKSGQNGLELKKDIALWEKYGLREDVKRVIACKERVD
ncbi:hypothetical protein [Aquimarina sp. AU474]|uniref:hypothetical protein n=1 Tax=Aquimarina sp. AU474 TaxID=2108529 RepID=UPI000D685637|nr:hypothetical protein [Aquimarina sp. AU474]